MDFFRNGNGWYVFIFGIWGGNVGEIGEEDYGKRFVVFTEILVLLEEFGFLGIYYRLWG